MEKLNKMEVNADKKVNPLSPNRRAARSAYQVPIFWFVNRPLKSKPPRLLKFVFPFHVL